MKLNWLIVLIPLTTFAVEPEVSDEAMAYVSEFVRSKNAMREDPWNSKVQARANNALAELIRNESEATNEALAVLAGHYLGESQEPECEILRRGKKMVPLLQKFIESPPTIDLPISPSDSRQELVEQINKQVTCVYM